MKIFRGNVYEVVVLLSVVAVMPLLFSCEDTSTDFEASERTSAMSSTSGTLYPGGAVTGPEDIRISASDEALEDPIEIDISIAEPPNEEIPYPLEIRSNFYSVSAADPFPSLSDGLFRASIPIPTGVDEDELVMAFWVPEDMTPGNIGGFWEPVDGTATENEFTSYFYYIGGDKPTYFVLAEGDWFGDRVVTAGDGDNGGDGDSESLDGMTTTADDSTTFGVLPVGPNNEDLLDSETASVLAPYLNDMAGDLLERCLLDECMPTPALHEPLNDDIDYVVQIMEYQEVDPDNTCVQDGDCLTRCTYQYVKNDDDEIYATRVDRRGSFLPLVKAAITCVWPADKRAPTLVVSSVEEGDQFIVEIEKEDPEEEDFIVVEVIAESDDTPSDIAYKIAQEIRSKSAGALPSVFPWDIPAVSLGNKVVLYYRNVLRHWTPKIEVEGVGAGDFDTLEYEYANLFTAMHEVFHAIQYEGLQWSKKAGAANNIQNSYLEGTAVAAQEAMYRNESGSITPLRRAASRDERSLDPLGFLDSSGAGSADPPDYRAQDFFVTVSHMLSEKSTSTWNIEWLIPAMEGGGHRNDLIGALDHFNFLSFSEAYWGYVRNKFIEKRYALDDLDSDSSMWAESCEPSTTALFDFNDDHWHEVEYSGGEETVSFDIPYAYGPSVLEIEFPDQYEGESFIVEASGSPSTDIAVYRNYYESDEECFIDPNNPDEVPEIDGIFVGPDADKIYVLAYSNEAGIDFDESVDVTIEPSEVVAFLLHEEGERQIGGQPLDAHALAFGGVNAAPITVDWFYNGEQFDSETVDDNISLVSTTLDDTCPTDPGKLEVNITDDRGGKAQDEVSFDFHGIASQLTIGTTAEVFSSCGSQYIPTDTDGKVPDMTLTAYNKGCTDLTDDKNWIWQIDGEVVCEGCEEIELEDDDFRNEGELVPVTVRTTHEDIHGNTRRTFRPCKESCIDPEPCGLVPLRPEHDRLARDVMDNIDAIMTFEHEIFRVFNDLVPDLFPPEEQIVFDKLESHVGRSVNDVLDTMRRAFEVSELDEFYSVLEKSREDITNVESEEEKLFLYRMLALVETQVDYYNPPEVGGMGGWYDLSFLENWTKDAPNSIDLAHRGFLYALATWADALERLASDDSLPLDDEVVTKRAFEAASLGATRDVIDEYLLE